jgi:hypothetical protein
MVSRCHAAALGREQRLFFGAIGVAVASILVWKSFDTCPFTQGALTSDKAHSVTIGITAGPALAGVAPHPVPHRLSSISTTRPPTKRRGGDVTPMHPTHTNDHTGVGSDLRSCWASSLSIRPYEGDNALPPQWQSATGQPGCFPGWPLLASLPLLPRPAVGHRTTNAPPLTTAS